MNRKDNKTILYICNFINIIKILPALQESFDWLLIVVEFLLLNRYSFFILTIE